MVSVIILNYNGRKNLGVLLEKCLESVLKTDYPNFEVLFVDNASTDNSAEFVKRKFGQNQKLRIIRNKRNFGFAEGNNIGIRNAQGEYIALLGSDIRVDPKWLKELAKAIQLPEIGAAQSKLLRMDEPHLFDCAGGFIDYYGYSNDRGHGEEDRGQYNFFDEIFYAKGAACILKRKVLKEVGLFDQEFFIYYEDADLCWRMRLRGYKIIFVPTSIVYHTTGKTISKLQKSIQRYFFTRNLMFTLLKNYNRRNFCKYSIILSILELRNALLFTIRGAAFTGIAIVKALLWNFLNLRRNLRKRGTVQLLIRRLPDEMIKKVMNKPYPPFPQCLIPRSYFLKRRLYFR